MDISISINSAVITGASSSLVPDNHVGVVIVFGQSLALGTNSTPILTDATLTNAKMLQTSRPHMDSITAPANENTPFDPDVLTTINSLDEAVSSNTSNDLGETPLSGIATELDAVTDNDIIYISTGKGALRLDELNQDNWHFANIAAYIDMIEDLTSLSVYHLATVIVHGTADAAASTTKANYKSRLLSMTRDINRYIFDKTGISSSPKTIISQCGSLPAAGTITDIQQGQAELCVEEGWQLLPMYDKTFADNAHLDAQGSRDFGVDVGRIIKSGDNSIIPTSVSVSGSIITINVAETGLTEDAGITPDANNGLRLDSGTITDVTISTSSIAVTFTGSPTEISCAQNTTLIVSDFPNESQTDIWDGTNRMCAWKVPTTWTAPAADPYVLPTYTHTPTTDDNTIINTLGFVTWKRFDPALMDGSRLPCYGKSGNDSTIDGTTPTATAINSVDCMDLAGSVFFTSDRSEFPTGDYTVIMVGQLNNTNNNQMMCLHNSSARRYYLTSNTNLVWGTGTHNAATTAQGTGTPFIYVISYNYKDEEIKTRLNGGTTVVTSGHATFVNNPNQYTQIIDGGLMNSGTVINKSNNIHCDRLAFSRDLIADGTISAIETILISRYNIT